jgi:glutaredoxin-related protein|tara:strand:- start:253 stop:693 length:441 start_codon:yes stop_codon:yes gene_type:complete
MTQKDILFYSLLCAYSKEVLELLKKTHLDKQFVLVNINDDNINLPEFIKVVPTIFLHEEKTLIIDEEIIKCIEKKNAELNVDIGAYDNDVFSGFFSNLNNDEISNNNDYFSSINDNIESLKDIPEPKQRSLEDYQRERNIDLNNPN